MKTFCAWLLVLFAVLVPATAALMAPVFSPPASAAKQAQLRVQGHPGKSPGVHVKAKAYNAANHVVAKAASHDKRSAGTVHAEVCSDCGPCNLCSACGSAGSMVIAFGGPLLPASSESLLVPEQAGGQAQFISGGQYRPPRNA